MEYAHLPTLVLCMCTNFYQSVCIFTRIRNTFKIFVPCDALYLSHCVENHVRSMLHDALSESLSNALSTNSQSLMLFLNAIHLNQFYVLPNVLSFIILIICLQKMFKIKRVVGARVTGGMRTRTKIPTNLSLIHLDSRALLYCALCCLAKNV